MHPNLNEPSSAIVASIPCQTCGLESWADPVAMTQPANLVVQAGLTYARWGIYNCPGGHVTRVPYDTVIVSKGTLGSILSDLGH